MVRATELSMLVVSALLAVDASLASPSVVALLVLAALLTMFDALQRPSLDALLSRLVPREDLVPAAALESLRGTAGQIAGPAAGARSWLSPGYR